MLKTDAIEIPLIVYAEDTKRKEEAAALARRLLAPFTEDRKEAGSAQLILKFSKEGLILSGDGLEMKGDFSRLKRRVTENRWQHELLVKAAKVKDTDHQLTAVDCTAGLGEDSFLLAAAGLRVFMFEKDPVIAALCKDALRRAKKLPEIREIAARMSLEEGDSTIALTKMTEAPDIVYMDPMFPSRQKSALIKKKFQLLHQLEEPAEKEEENAMLNAAISLHPEKIIIKRPPKGPYVGGIKPAYSLEGKAVRFDCILP